MRRAGPAAPTGRARWIAGLLAAATLLPVPGAAQEGRRMAPADLQRLRPVWMSSLAPDGRHVAMIVGRDTTRRSPYFGPGDTFSLQGDLWVAPLAGGEPLNVTRGDKDRSTSWQLVWSPKGTRLATLTTRGYADRAGVLVWTAGSRSSEVVTGEPVYTGTRARRSGESENTPVVWLNEDELLYVAVGVGHDATTMDVAPEAWRRARAGQEASVSVLDSGKAQAEGAVRWSTLRHLHIPSGKVTTLATVPPRYQRRNSITLVLAPDARHVAVIGDIGPNTVPADAPISGDNERRTRIGIVALDGSDARAELMSWLPGIAGPQESSLRWSPDGARIAFAAKPGPAGTAATDPDGPSRTLFVAGVDRSVRPLERETLQVSAIEWLDEVRLIAKGRENKPSPGDEASPVREDWWRMDVSGGQRIPLTAALQSAPASLVRLGDGRFVAPGKDGWSVVDADGARVLPQPAGPRLKSLAWPRRGAVADGNVLLAESEDATGDKQAPLYRVDIQGERVEARPIARPAPRARFVGFHRAADGAGTAVFSGATDDGTFVWASREGQAARALFANNTFISQIMTGPRRLIDYRDADGTPLKAALLLPPGYKDGTAIPVMVWVYGGTMVTDTHVMDGKHGASLYNPELFAAKGIAVLFPSIPLAPNGSASGEPMLQIAQSVLPAVDRLVEMGIADPRRLAVGGVSYGAYSVYSLIAQTRRFRAAIANDGDANLFTSYTAFDGATRYLDGVHEVREGAWWAEASQGRMGVTPWRDPMRYVRNSPFFALDRIQTPLMIVHCDLDYVPLAHAEQMFAGLYRLGKTARLVRYYGEKHGPYSAANLQDLWRQMYRWLDEYLLAAT